MNIIETDNVTLYPDKALAALDRLERILERTHPGAQVDQVMRLVPDKRAVFQGRLDGRDVVFRLVLDPENLSESEKEWDEMTRSWAYMPDAPFRVAEPIFILPEHGLIAQEFVVGTPLLKHMWKIDHADRPPLIADTARWLNTYCTPSFEWRAGNMRGWRKRAVAAAETQPHEHLKKIESRVVRKMHQLARRLDTPDWRVALSHGDFHANNLILGPSGLTGIDTGGRHYLPIYKDIARILTHMSRRGFFATDSRRFGVDATAYDDFTRVFAMSEVEKNGILPFFIAFETLIKVEHPQMPAHRVEHAHAMATSLFQDLRNIT